MKQQFLKPGPGLKTRKPDGTYLSAEGEWVPLTTYWRRRLADGDAVKSRPKRKTQQPQRAPE